MKMLLLVTLRYLPALLKHLAAFANHDNVTEMSYRPCKRFTTSFSPKEEEKGEPTAASKNDILQRTDFETGAGIPSHRIYHEAAKVRAG